MPARLQLLWDRSMPCGIFPPQNRAGRRVGRQRVTFTGTSPTAPPRTGHESFDLTAALQWSVYDSQNRVGASHLAYLDVLVVRPPVSLRRVDGSPVRGLLWRLRRHRTRIP